MSLCLWTVNFSVLVFPSQVGDDGRGVLELGISFPQGWLGSDNTLQVRLWLATCSSRQSLLRRTVLWYTSNGSFPPTPVGVRGFFFDIYCEDLVEPLDIRLTKLGG